jgi:hypothetical protein
VGSFAANGSYPAFFAFPALGFAVAMLTTLPIAAATSVLQRRP